MNCVGVFSFFLLFHRTKCQSFSIINFLSQNCLFFFKLISGNRKFGN